jgi:RNA-dependent RNA polymerase
VANSTVVFVIVDPVGVLGEDEVFCYLSQEIIDPRSGAATNAVKGPVLVTRSPCNLPTDIRKVTAVYKDELAQYRDVIIFPRVGKRPLCSLLSGGD